MKARGLIRTQPDLYWRESHRHPGLSLAETRFVYPPDATPPTVFAGWTVLFRLADLALLLQRLLVGLVFGTSRWRDLKDPAARSKNVGMSKGFTVFLGAAKLAGALGLAFGVLTRLAALGLILLGLGAIQKKIFVWHTGFWGKHGTGGWHYDLMLIIMNLVIITTGGGSYVLWR